MWEVVEEKEVEVKDGPFRAEMLPNGLVLVRNMLSGLEGTYYPSGRLRGGMRWYGLDRIRVASLVCRIARQAGVYKSFYDEEEDFVGVEEADDE